MGAVLGLLKSFITPVRRYRPLDAHNKEIRLLLVQAGSPDEPIRCSLNHAFLTDEAGPVYETISYVWGDASIRATILLENEEVSVPASSERVLRRMRYPDKDRTLWIDAICINQDDLQERSMQVSIMYEIYSSTSRNLVWLGEDDGYTEQAITSINALLEEIRQETDDFASWTEMLHPGGIGAWAQAGFSAEFDVTALFHFLSSPFFERPWIVQEVALARESICYRGAFEIPLQNVLKVASWINYKWLSVPETDLAPKVSPVMLIAEWADHEHGLYARSGPGQGRLLNLLESLRQFRCQDPRDHVFGLLGLHRKFSPDTTVNLAPDYSELLEDVLIRATRSTIQGRRDLACLHFLSHETADSLMNGVPSWVPRFDRAYKVGQEAVDFNLPFTHIMACGDRTQAWEPSEEEVGPVLSARGFVVDIVVAAIETFHEGSGLADMRDFFERTKTLCDTNSEGEHALTLVGGATHSRTAVDEDEAISLYTTYNDFLEANKNWPKYAILSNPSPEGTSRDAIIFSESLKHACYKRRFFRTELGYIGLGPQVMQAGDHLAILHGCRWPMMLRRIENEGLEDCLLLGLCYVGRIMNGEAVESFEEQGGEDVIFRIH